MTFLLLSWMLSGGMLLLVTRVCVAQSMPGALHCLRLLTLACTASTSRLSVAFTAEHLVSLHSVDMHCLCSRCARPVFFYLLQVACREYGLEDDCIVDTMRDVDTNNVWTPEPIPQPRSLAPFSLHPTPCTDTSAHGSGRGRRCGIALSSSSSLCSCWCCLGAAVSF